MSRDFFYKIPRAQEAKANIVIALHHTEKLLYNKGSNHQSDETACRMGKMFANNIFEKGLI
jgi:hypothetical protein